MEELAEDAGVAGVAVGVEVVDLLGEMGHLEEMEVEVCLIVCFGGVPMEVQTGAERGVGMEVDVVGAEEDAEAESQFHNLYTFLYCQNKEFFVRLFQEIAILSSIVELQ